VVTFVRIEELRAGPDGEPAFFMPSRTKRPCAHPGCATLVDRRRCPAHTRQLRLEQEARRETSHRRGYDRRWAKARAVFLTRHPLCAACYSKGLITAAAEVDHVVPHRGDPALFWDPGNWQALCKPCHSAKTARERGWGRGA
jgi:5-methylcytosine-specific restriction protein A